jgi:glucosamine--fructose-6-phosphate aminotransferase (isomerizing)
MTRFRSEVEQMPAALLRLAAWYGGEGSGLLLDMGRRLRGARNVVWSGMGTSWFTPEAVFPRLRAAGLACTALDAGELLHFGGVPGPQEIAVLTSQSGESVEVLRLIEEGRVRPGFIAVTNDTGSTLARKAGLVLPLHAGEEASISNKTYSNTLGLLHLAAAAVEGTGALTAALDDLRGAADALGRPVDAEEAAACLAPATGVAFVGRGPAYVTARQCALTFMEGVRCLASAFTGGGFNHGPFESVQDGFRLVIFQPDGRTRALTEALAGRAAARGAGVVLVTAGTAPRIDGVRVLAVPGLAGNGTDPDALFPLLASRVQNVLLEAVAAARGHEAGIFRYGAKVTTHE